ncbi:chitosanase [Microseira wollei]|uniref:Chitosanase n=1 Tax=Microseira wollei NIES-4236 TaxID=2530354 RepID=A0AAV3XE63_9CYAN|nr:chitosanase [Microseira wollei]GET40823.1 Chitosanase [Microseira wollei NIES-4236]
MLTDLQKQTAQASVNIFETGKVQGDYSNVTFVASDPGGLTYGRSQTTLMSGNLFLLIKAYCEAEEAEFATELRAYLSAIGAKDTRINRDMNLRSLLQKAGEDPVMQDVQDAFFDRVYWNPSVKNAENMGIQTALGVAVVYDSVVHGSWQLMRDRTLNQGTVATLGEQSWIKSYIDIRREWLANNRITLLRKTVYRMDSFKQLIANQKWDLTLPLTVRGLVISEETLIKSLRMSGDDVESMRLLQLRQPFMRGEDVREVQQALRKAGFIADCSLLLYTFDQCAGTLKGARTLVETQGLYLTELQSAVISKSMVFLAQIPIQQ